jgi:hypothetical protein
MIQNFQFNLNLIISQIQPLKQFQNTKAHVLDFESIDLHVKNILSILNLCNDNICHYFVEVKSYNCEPPHEVSNLCPIDIVSDLQLVNQKSTTSHVLAFKTLMMHNNNHIALLQFTLVFLLCFLVKEYPK